MSTLATSYDPAQRYELKVWDVEFRRDPVRPLLARIYQPQAPGPFPTILKVHGGGWNSQDRTGNAEVDMELAKSGLLIVAIDLRLASEQPYPASVADANFGVRWLKSKAQEWNGDPQTVAIFGSSSGGHVVELVAMRPFDPRYTALPLAEAPELDATVAYMVARSPISDPYVRYQHAQEKGRNSAQSSEVYFQPWDTIFEGNPQQILDRGEPIARPPMCILHGALDDNMPPAAQERFVASYRTAGGEIDFHMLPDMEHQWQPLGPGSPTNRGIDLIKAFIARQLH